MSTKILKFIDSYATWFMIIAATVYFLIFSLVCTWKLNTVQYNALDLAIFNQVFYNSAHGDLFASSIHPPSYLGDHFSPIILLLLPFYLVYQQPITLLILQTLLISLAAILLYFIATKHLNSGTSLALGIIWLANPLTQNFNLYEFHPEAILPLLFFSALYFYKQNRFKLFGLFLILTLIIREDMALLVFMWGIIALIDRKPLKWWLTPIIASPLYFLGAMKVINHFAPDGQSKFWHYYSWLGTNFQEIILSPTTKPLLIIKHLLTFGNVELFIGLLIPFLFLPLLRPKFLLLSALILAEFLFSNSGGSSLMLEINYVMLFLPTLIITLLESLIYLQNKTITPSKKLTPQKIILENKTFFLLLLIFSAFFTGYSTGPLPSAVKNIFYPDDELFFQTRDKQSILRQIPNNAPVVATEEFLTNLSSRQEIYPLNYVFLGHKQYSAAKYSVPNNIQYAAINFDAAVAFQLQYSRLPIYRNYYPVGYLNLQKLIDENKLFPEDINNNFSLFTKKPIDPTPILYTIKNNTPPATITDQEITLKSATMAPAGDGYSQLQTVWQVNTAPKNDYTLEFIARDTTSKQIWHKVVAPTYGLLPTTQWKQNDEITTNHLLSLPVEIFAQDVTVYVQLVEPTGWLILNGYKSINLYFNNLKAITESVPVTPPVRSLSN